VCLVDIGGERATSRCPRGAIRQRAVVPIAGEQITNDIAMALRTPTAEAEELQGPPGCALRQLAEAGQMIEVGRRRPPAQDALPPDARRGDRAPRRGALHPHPAGAARFPATRSCCPRSGVTGGLGRDAGHGRAGEEFFHMPVRLASPATRLAFGRGPQPRYARASACCERRSADAGRPGRAAGGSFRQVFGRMREWFQRNF